MDPKSAGPEEQGHDGQRPDETVERRIPRREAVTPALAYPSAGTQAHAGPARTVELISGEFLLTVNPVDGSEIEPCPPGRRPGTPQRRDLKDRAALQRAGRPSVPPGPAAPPLPLLERQDEHDRLVELLSDGRSVRVLGVPGSGRTALLDAVAARCATLAPDGLVRLSGYHRTATELLYELHATVLSGSSLNRPERAQLLASVQDIGAVVVIDDLEIGGEALDELLAATPECAYLLAGAPEASAPTPAAPVAEVLLAGLGRAASLELLERAVARPLTEEEANWAGDLWFESEGLPLRFVQAGALLRQRDQLRRDPQIFDEFEPFAKAKGSAQDTTSETAFDHAFDGAFDAGDSYDIPLPSLGEGAAPAALLASRLSESARATLRFAVALGGEVPHQAHLPALVGDTHADAALGELMSCALLTPVGSRYRLAPGVAAQLEADGYGDDALGHAHTAAQHYAWWTGHPSVTPERVAAEADAVLGAMAPLLPEQGAGAASDADGSRPSAAVLLARSAAPAFLAGMHWGAWEKALRTGQQAARIAGEVAEEAYFHHELGVLALCMGNLDRARAELEASIGMRGAVADKSGTVAGRRALALVTDLESEVAADGFEEPTAESEAAAAPAIVAALPAKPAAETLRTLSATTPTAATQAFGTITYGTVGASPSGGRKLFGGARRNLVAAGAGAVLAAVLGTVVALGATSGNDPQNPGSVSTEQSTDPDGDGMPAQQPAGDAPAATSSGSQGGGDPVSPSAGGSGAQDQPPQPSTSPSSGSSSTSGGQQPDSPSQPGDGQDHSGGAQHPSSPGGSSSDHSSPPASTPTGSGSPSPSDSDTPPSSDPSTPESPDPSGSGGASHHPGHSDIPSESFSDTAPVV